MSWLSDLLDGGNDNQSSVNRQAGGSLLETLAVLDKGFGAIRNDENRANVSIFNSKVAGTNAALTGAESAANEQNLRLRQQETLGQQRANMAEAGTGGLNAGTNAGVLNQSEVNASMQALSERYRGDIQRTKYLNDQSLDEYYGTVDKRNADTDLTSTGLSATASLLNGFARYQKGLI